MTNHKHEWITDRMSTLTGIRCTDCGALGVECVACGGHGWIEDECARGRTCSACYGLSIIPVIPADRDTACRECPNARRTGRRSFGH
jgi:hypothetical protein